MANFIYNFFHKHYHSRYHGMYRHAKKLFVFDMSLVLFAIILLGTSIFYLVWKPGAVELVNLSLSLGNERIESGDGVRLTLHYTNHSKTTLTGNTLTLRLPSGFVIDRKITPENIFSKQFTFAIPTLKPGAEGQAEITGWLWSEPGQEEKIVANFSYVPDTTNQREQKITAFMATLPESVLKSSLVVATSSFPNYPLPFTYRLTNSGNHRVEHVTVYFTPEKITTDQDDFTDIALNSGETRTITGFLTPPSRTGGFPLEVRSAVLANGHIFQQLSDKREVTLFSPRIFAQARFLTEASYTEPGQKIPVEIQWRKESDVNLRNTRLRLALTPGTVDMKATAKENNLKIDGNSLIADTSNHPTQFSGSSDISNTLTVTLRFLPSFSLSQEAAFFEATPSLEGEMAEVPSQTFSETGSSAKIPLATELTMKSESHYYTPEGDQLGRGPLPPTVGEVTKYWVFIRLNNTTNPVRDATFETTLPYGVTFTGKQSVTTGPQLQYDGASRKMLWSYREIPANSLTGLYFEVAVNPTPEMIGRTIQLTKNTVFSAVDAVVGKAFSLSNDSLTNVLAGNDRGSSAGARVVAQ